MSRKNNRHFFHEIISLVVGWWVGTAVRCPSTLDCSPENKRVQAPYGARVLSFVRFAPNDGFRLQSGPVQREL